MTEFIFVRHAQSLGNMTGTFLGQTDLDLSPTGYRQAERTAEHIAKNYKVDRIFSSDLLRAYNTARALSRITDVPIETDVRLREIYAGDWEKKTFSEIAEQYPKEYGVWLSDIGAARASGGESVAELQKRALECLERIAAENDEKTVVISTHATVIRALECVWHGAGLDKMKDVAWVANSSVSVVEYSGGAWSARIIGDDSFVGELASKLPKNV